MSWLADSSYRVLTGTEFGRIRRGEMCLDRPAVLVTFDDGWLDNWVYAFPILQEFGIPAIWFIVTGWAGQGDARQGLLDSRWQSSGHEQAMKAVHGQVSRDSLVMRWSELREAQQTGLIDLESHSHSHGVWWRAASWAEMQSSLEQDLRQSGDLMERETGRRPTQFCWPKGQFSHSMVRKAAEEGFMVQDSVIRGNNRPNDNTLVRRINVEDRGASWLKERLNFYHFPFVGKCTGLLHGAIQGRRLKRAYEGRVPSQEFRFLGGCRVLANS